MTNQNLTTVTTSVKITPQQICDQLCAAFEGGCCYWVTRSELHVAPEGQVKREGHVWWGEENLFAPGLVFGVEYDNPHAGPDTASRYVTWGELLTGLHVMAEKYPQHFADVVDESGDAITGDVYLQCVLFGEVVYV